MLNNLAASTTACFFEVIYVSVELQQRLKYAKPQYLHQNWQAANILGKQLYEGDCLMSKVALESEGTDCGFTVDVLYPYQNRGKYSLPGIFSWIWNLSSPLHRVMCPSIALSLLLCHQEQWRPVSLGFQMKVLLCPVSRNSFKMRCQWLTLGTSDHEAGFLLTRDELYPLSSLSGGVRGPGCGGKLPLILLFSLYHHRFSSTAQQRVVVGNPTWNIRIRCPT